MNELQLIEELCDQIDIQNVAHDAYKNLIGDTFT